MKILEFVDRNFWLALVLTFAVTGCGWLMYQVYGGAQINATLVFRALLPALMWLSIWLGSRYWLRRYRAVDNASRQNRE